MTGEEAPAGAARLPGPPDLQHPDQAADQTRQAQALRGSFRDLQVLLSQSAELSHPALSPAVLLARNWPQEQAPCRALPLVAGLSSAILWSEAKQGLLL